MAIPIFYGDFCAMKTTKSLTWSLLSSQSSHPYILVQFHGNNLYFTDELSSLKKHSRLLNDLPKKIQSLFKNITFVGKLTCNNMPKMCKCMNIVNGRRPINCRVADLL